LNLAYKLNQFNPFYRKITIFKNILNFVGTASKETEAQNVEEVKTECKTAEANADEAKVDEAKVVEPKVDEVKTEDVTSTEGEADKKVEAKPDE